MTTVLPLVVQPALRLRRACVSLLVVMLQDAGVMKFVVRMERLAQGAGVVLGMQLLLRRENFRGRQDDKRYRRKSCKHKGHVVVRHGKVDSSS